MLGKKLEDDGKCGLGACGRERWLCVIWELVEAGLGFRRRKPVFDTDSGVNVINLVFDTYRRRNLS